MKPSFLHAYGPLLLAVLIGAALGAALGYFGQCTSGTCPFTSTWWRGALYGGVLGLIFGAVSKSTNRSSEQSEKPSASKPATSQVAETHEPPDAGKSGRHS
jgi:hypothetical protein